MQWFWIKLLPLKLFGLLAYLFLVFRTLHAPIQLHPFVIFFQAILFSFGAPVRLLRFLLQLQVHQWVMTVSVMKFCVQCSGMTSCSCRCLRVHTLSHSMPSRPCMPSHPNEMDDCQGRNQRIRGNIYVFELQKRQRADNPSSSCSDDADHLFG